MTNNDKGLTSLRQFKAKEGQDDAERAAEFLFWASKKLPNRAVPVTHIVRVALSLPKLPGEDSGRVEDFKKRRMGRVRKILFEKYRRALLPIPGYGYRSTTGSEDTAVTYQEQKLRWLQSAVQGVDKARSIIDRKDLKGATKTRFDEVGKSLTRLRAPLKALKAPEEEE